MVIFIEVENNSLDGSVIHCSLEAYWKCTYVHTCCYSWIQLYLCSCMVFSLFFTLLPYYILQKFPLINEPYCPPSHERDKWILITQGGTRSPFKKTTLNQSLPDEYLCVFMSDLSRGFRYCILSIIMIIFDPLRLKYRIPTKNERSSLQ